MFFCGILSNQICSGNSHRDNGYAKHNGILDDQPAGAGQKGEFMSVGADCWHPSLRRCHKEWQCCASHQHEKETFTAETVAQAYTKRSIAHSLFSFGASFDSYLGWCLLPCFGRLKKNAVTFTSFENPNVFVYRQINEMSDERATRTTHHQMVDSRFLLPERYLLTM
jgi:hypothetical protein